LINVIHEKSFDGTTLRAIAKEAGISPGLAHHYFPSKEKLLEATIRSLLCWNPRQARRGPTIDTWQYLVHTG